MLHSFDMIKRDLQQMDSSMFATKWYFDTMPFVFEGDEKAYISWRHLISAEIDIDPSDILLTGSASLGISLNPYKNFKAFDNQSDIDICIFSEYYFSIAWRELSSKTMVNLSYPMQTAIKKHKDTYIYWGTVATDKILPLLSFGAKWGRIIPKLSKFEAIGDHDVHFRIYKDRLSFRRYLLQSIEERKIALLEGKNNE